jgi:MFS transporter, DHA2 family, multidrug resistance protein
MTKSIPIFKPWVPEWFIKVMMFIVLLPSLVLFFLPIANINAAAGYYGIEPLDVQYLVVLFYAGYTSFYSLERRFFQYLATKEYFFIITFIQILTCFLCYLTQELAILFVLRFIQGMAFTSTVNLSLTLIFNRLRNERAREIGYSVFYGMLICMIPFDNFITAEAIDAFNFNTLYKGAMFSYLPSLVLIGVLMNNIRFNIKFPLYQLDWASFVLYGMLLCLTGYVLVYGQEYYWLEDERIRHSALGIVLLLVLFVIRQFKRKRPYFNLKVFKSRNFKVGALVLFILYICRFAFGIATNYFGTVLGLDPIHISYLTLFNIAGMVVGVITSCIFVLQHRPIRLLWIYGFALLLVYHFWMFFLFNTQANETEFMVPLILQGLGVGMLMTPTIIFMVSAVPVRLGATAAGICLLVRCFGYYCSIALLNFFELYSKSKHYNTFQDRLSKLSPVVEQTAFKQSENLIGKGINAGQAAKISNKLFIRSVDIQDQIRYAMDYYEMIGLLLVLTLLLVGLFPYLNKTILYLKKNRPAPF